MVEYVAGSASFAAKPCFTVAPGDGGGWIARDRRAGIERHFASQQAALHFVLFQFGRGAASALLTPRA